MKLVFKMTNIDEQIKRHVEDILPDYAPYEEFEDHMIEYEALVKKYLKYGEYLTVEITHDGAEVLEVE